MTHTRVIRILVLLGVLAVAAYSISQMGASDREFIEKLKAARKQKDHTFRGSGSPLPEEAKSTFQGLAYFEPNPKLRFRVAMQKLENPEPVQIQTTGNQTQQYTKYARATFSLNGKDYSLFLYQRPAGTSDRSFFVPFTDLTNGHTTYGGGRYLDIEPVAPGEVELDFNQAYNPYCAYNHEYSCPIPPQENHLEVEIPAGEKNFGSH